MLTKRLVILSGPSCVGKGPVASAVKKFHPEINYESVPVIKSKESRGNKPRPDEVDIWDNPDFFRMNDEIAELRNYSRYIVGDCRGFLQAIDLEKVTKAKGDLIFVEIYHTLGRQLRTSRYLSDTKITTLFMSPLSQKEVQLLRACKVCLTSYLKGLMAQKQLVRAGFQRKSVDRALLEDIETRAEDAIDELRSAPDYTFVIVNHDGEGCANWGRKPDGEFTQEPRGDAKGSMDTLVAIMRNENPTNVEQWPHGAI